MAKKDKPFTLIVAEPEQAINKPISDRGGGEAQSFWGKSATKAAAKVVDPKVVKENFEKSLEQTNEMLKNASAKIASGWEIDEITLSFAVTGEGSIGIATVGVEAGIEIKLKPVKK